MPISQTWWRRVRFAAMAATLLLPAVVAHAQDAAAPQLQDLPGTLLIASTRDSAQQGDTADKYRLYTLQQGQLNRILLPDDADSLGSNSASLSQDGQRLLVNAGGRAIYLIDIPGNTPPQQIGDRLPPVSVGQTDTYLSVALSPDGTKAVVNRPFPVGLSLVSLSDGTSTQLPVIGQNPSFSPDGTQLAMAFTAPAAPTAAIFVGNLGQLNGLAKLSDSSNFETAPAWRLDGSGIAFVAAGAQWQVQEVTLPGATPAVLAQAPDGFLISDVAMSPDGAWVAYTLQSKGAPHRLVHIASTSDPTVGIDLPQDSQWNDRVLGWVAGS